MIPEARLLPGFWPEALCWNAMDAGQQERQRVTNYHEGPPMGFCDREATVAITLREDKAPGPRLYCRRCAVAYLEG